MIESLVLIEGSGVKEENLMISLSNAKQLIIGNSNTFGVILHIAANSPEDLSNALIEFAKISDVEKVVTLVLQSQK